MVKWIKNELPFYLFIGLAIIGVYLFLSIFGNWWNNAPTGTETNQQTIIDLSN